MEHAVPLESTHGHNSNENEDDTLPTDPTLLTANNNQGVHSCNRSAGPERILFLTATKYRGIVTSLHCPTNKHFVDYLVSLPDPRLMDKYTLKFGRLLCLL
mmetsp:Transcript_21118/g.35452  ORF Transcript_21118/g.35452 Transcript_21118/m.35452 type:complete len:101 (-) Transcript_21118:940-1242(-)